MNRCPEVIPGHCTEEKPRKPLTTASDSLIVSSFSILADGAVAFRAQS